MADSTPRTLRQSTTVGQSQYELAKDKQLQGQGQRLPTIEIKKKHAAGKTEGRHLHRGHMDHQMRAVNASVDAAGLSGALASRLDPRRVAFSHTMMADSLNYQEFSHLAAGASNERQHRSKQIRSDRKSPRVRATKTEARQEQDKIHARFPRLTLAHGNTRDHLGGGFNVNQAVKNKRMNATSTAGRKFL